MILTNYIHRLFEVLPELEDYDNPWQATTELESIIEKIIARLDANEFQIADKIAIHRTAIIEPNVVIKPHTIISASATVKAGSYLRSGVYIGDGASIGANCEIKQSIIFDQARIAHLNYVGNSIVGEDVNMEAGSILANHFNEREDKNISVVVDRKLISTGCTKFGALVGDHSRIGANAVTNPGTVLPPKTIVGRLTHIDQVKAFES